MNKKPVGSRSKIILLSGLILAIVAGGGAYFYYGNWRKSQVVQEAAQSQAIHSTAISEVDAMGFRGDRILAASYVEQIKKNNLSAAAKLFADKINAEPDTNKKISLYNQEVILASHYKVYDHAVQAALAADSLRSSFISLATIARVYGLKGDTAQQVSYLRKTIAAIDHLPAGTDRDSMREDYQAQLAKAEGRAK